MASTGIIYTLIARDAASRTFHQVGRAASSTDSVLGKLGRTAKVAGEAIAVGLAAGLAEGAKSAMEFQSEMTRIQTQAGGTAKDVKVLSDQVLKLGTSTQQGPQALAESLYHLKSVGMDNVSAMKALKEASDLAAVGHANLEETTNALAGAWRTGIKGATSFHEAVSTVNAIIGAGNMSMDQFNAAIGTGILPSAKTFGLSMKQVGAALALMTDEGIDSASAATRLRMSFSLLGAPSGAAEKQLKKIHLTGLQLAEAMRSKDGLIGAVQLLKEHLDASGMSASQQSQLLSRAFGGGRSSSGILLMLNNLDVLKKKQDQINRSTGKFDDAVKQQRKTAEAQWHLLTSNLEVMGIRVGTKVLPYVTNFVKFLATDAMPAANRFGEAVGSMIPFGTIKKGFDDTRKLIGDFFGGLKGPKAPKALPVPMLKAPDVVTPLKPAASDAANFGKTIHDAISGGFADIDWGSLGKTLGEGLGQAFQWLVSHGADVAKKLGEAIGKIDWVNVGKVFGGIALPLAIGFVDNLFDPLFHKDFWEKHWLDTILAVISIVPIGKVLGVAGKLLSKIPWGKLGEVLLKIPWQKIIPFGAKLAEALPKIFVLINEFIGSIVLRFGQAIAARFPRIAGWFVRELNLLPTRLGVIGLNLVAKGKQMIANLGRALVDHVPGMGNRFIRAAAKVFGRFTLWQTGLNLAESLINGAWSKLKSIGSWMKQHLVNPVIHWVKSGFGIASPSKVFTGIGRNLISGFEHGVANAAKGIGGWIVDHVVSPVTSRFAHAGSWLVGKGGALISGFKSGAYSIGKSIGGWMTSHVANPARNVFSRANTWLTSKGSALVSGFKSGISGAMKGIGGWLKSVIVDPVVGAVRHYFGIKSPSRVFMSIGGHLVGGLIKGMARTNGTTIAKKIFGDMPSALGSIVSKGLVSITSLPGKAMSALGSLGSKLGSLFGKLFGGGGGGGNVSRWSGDVAAVLAMLGAPASALPAVLKRISIESGGNPNAINLWDSNAKAGDPSRGLMQTIGSTFSAYAGPFASRGIYDPLASIYAGVNYAMHRYGANWISVMTRPGGYAKGTQGGAAKGLAWVGERGPELVNFKGGEDVLSHPQSMAFAKANGIKLPGYVSGTISNAADRVHRDRQRVEDAKDALANARRRRKGVAAAEKRLQAAERELQAANISLRNAQRSAKTSIANSLATGLQKTLATGTSSAIASAIKSLATKLLNAGFNRTASGVERKGGQLEKLAGKRDALQKTIDAANQYASDQAGNIKDFLSISGTSATNVGDLISQATGQQKTASNFVALTKSLKARGASKDLLQQLSDAGPGSQLATILSAKNVTTTDIAKLNKLMSSGNKLATSFGKDMADLMYDSGKDASKGFLAGLKSQQKALEKQMAKLAKDLVNQIKKALKIKSPSQVFRDEVGKQVVLGMAHGIDMHSHLVGAATQRLADTATGVSLRRRYVPTAASGRTGPSQEEIWGRLAAAIEASGQEVHVHFNDDRLRDLIDVQVKPKIKASEDRQAFRARVGRR